MEKCFKAMLEEYTQKVPRGHPTLKLYGLIQKLIPLDVGGVQAHVGGLAVEAAAEIGATAYTTGNHVAFARPPDLHTAAHAVQQRFGVQLAGGVGQAGDRYERHADAVVDAVVWGRSAEGLLSDGTGGMGVVQRRDAFVGSIVMREECTTGNGRGPANVENTAHDIGDVLDRWHEYAYAGADEFVTGELGRAIASLGDGNWRTFLISLVGNTVWASSAFRSVPGEVFALSMAGVVIAASPTVPSRNSAMQDLQVVHTRLHDYIDEVYTQLFPQRTAKARALLAARSGITRNGAIQEFLAATFPGMYSPVDTRTREPILDPRRVREAYRREASTIFQLARTPYYSREVDPSSGVVLTEEQTFCMVTGVPHGPRLAVVHGMGAAIPHQAMRYSFVRWVDHKYLPNVREIIGGEPPSRAASSISGVPTS